jgi:predicted metal-dependent HD superfamily phosphohydrolase
LASLDLVKHSAIHKNELELALWFHDAVYKPLCACNEYKSAEWAREFLIQNSVNEETINLVTQLIRATEHSVKSEQGDDLLIADIDIAILGQSQDVYEKYARDVRYEYRQVPSFIYKKKRKTLLESFLSKPNIYSTAHFYQTFENQARKNLTNEIRRL